jgi:flagellar hook-basal body complex protein FliE
MASSAAINGVLAQMRALALQSEGMQPPNAAVPVSGNNFGDMLSQAINQVNTMQQNASAQATRFERGEDVDVAKVMVDMSKAKVAFTGMVEVRNKLLQAYQEVMSMTV